MPSSVRKWDPCHVKAWDLAASASICCPYAVPWNSTLELSSTYRNRNYTIPFPIQRVLGHLLSPEAERWRWCVSDKRSQAAARQDKISREYTRTRSRRAASPDLYTDADDSKEPGVETCSEWSGVWRYCTPPCSNDLAEDKGLLGECIGSHMYLAVCFIELFKMLLSALMICLAGSWWKCIDKGSPNLYVASTAGRSLSAIVYI